MRSGSASISLSRREIVAGAVLGGLGVVTGAAHAAPAPAAAFAPAIDVHHHCIPPSYHAVAAGWLTRYTEDADRILLWTPERSLAVMDEAAIDVAVLSISAPGAIAGGRDDAAAVARGCNDYMAELCAKRPDRFRFFAALPMPDVAASIAEVERLLAGHRPAGFGLLSNHAGRYLGDPAFDPLLARIDAAGLPIYIHPTMPDTRLDLLPINASAIEFPTDTARTLASLLWAGALSRYTRTRFIAAHGGGVLPMVADRVRNAGARRPELLARVPDGVATALRRVFVDVASIANLAGIDATRDLYGPEHVVFGTDYPWGAPLALRQSLARLELPPDQRKAIERDNAGRLLGLA